MCVLGVCSCMGCCFVPPGFSTELDRVKNLPYCKTETFEVKFDPRGANLDLGAVSCVLPIQVDTSPGTNHKSVCLDMPALIGCCV